MDTRNVLARHRGPDGLPLPGAWIRYTLIPGTYLGDAAGSQFLRKSLTRYADEEGDTVAPLLVNSAGVIATQYLVEDSSGQDPYYVTVPEGAVDITLSDARALYDGPEGASTTGLVEWIRARWRGAWEAVPSPAYELGQMVYHLDSSWIATQDVPVGAPALDPLNADWDPVALGIDVDAALTIVDDAEAAAVLAVAARDLAEEWAENPEDDPVVTGPDQFSAMHWALKAEEAGAGSNKFAINAAIDGAFAQTPTPTLGGAPRRVPFDTPLAEIHLDCAVAPLGASWTVETYRTPAAGGAAELIVTTSILSGQVHGISEDLGLTLLQDELITWKCTSVGTADTGSDGGILLRGESE